MTTYTIPTGEECSSIEACNYHDLTSTAADGTVLYGLFETGGYYTQFDYQAYQGQNPGYKAQYCNGTAVWTAATIDSTHNEYTMDCNATGVDGPTKIHAVIDAHSFVVTYVCGVRVRYVCHATRWMVDDGWLTISSTSSV